jgi:hypothetical protein
MEVFIVLIVKDFKVQFYYSKMPIYTCKNCGKRILIEVMIKYRMEKK